MTLHVAQTVDRGQLQHCIYYRTMVCFRHVIVNTLHRGDDDDKIIIITALRIKG